MARASLLTQGPRGLGWRSDKPAELYWIEAQVSGIFAGHHATTTLLNRPTIAR